MKTKTLFTLMNTDGLQYDVYPSPFKKAIVPPPAPFLIVDEKDRGQVDGILKAFSLIGNGFLANELVLVIPNNYIAILKRPDRRGRLRKVTQIGNVGVALDFVRTLRKLGHKVKIDDQSEAEGV